MPEITLDQLEQQTGIDKEKLLKRIQHSYPDYRGQAIDGAVAFAWIPNLRKTDAGDASLSIRESTALIGQLGAIAERPYEDPQAAGASTAEPDQPPITGQPDMSENETEATKDRARQEWNRDAALRAEFGDSFESYLAYSEAVAAGKVRVANSTVKRGADYV